MTTLGITGHIGLTDATIRLVRAEIDDILRAVDPPVEGWTSLAVGADQIFAEAVLEAQGALVLVRPWSNVEATIPVERREVFRALRVAGREVRLPFTVASDEAYWAAGQRIAETVALLIAVWDGGPSKGLGALRA